MSQAFELRESSARKRRSGRAATADESSREERIPAGILCAACRTRLSDRAAIFAMSPAGASGVFVNPHGIAHEIFTVKKAENLIHLGSPTIEFTWFPGYAWEIALCAGCRLHVGWHFTTIGPGEPPDFWGLRRAATVEDPGS